MLTGGAAATTALTAENGRSCPRAFVPVTRERSVPPMSAATAVYVERGRAAGCPRRTRPAALQRCHW